MLLQPVANIAEICARKGVEQVVLSPGSRCAPLTIAFARHPKLTVRTVSRAEVRTCRGRGIFPAGAAAGAHRRQTPRMD